MRAELSATGAGAGAAPVEYAVAVERFLAQACLSPASRRVYRISLAGWAWALVGQPPPAGSQRRGARPPVVPLALLDHGDAPAKLAAAVALRAGRADTRTVNREISALRSAAGWWLDMGWIGRDPTAGLRHRTTGVAARPALSDRQAAAVFELPAGLREQALWRLLRDTGSPADEILALDVTAVDLARRQARSPAPSLAQARSLPQARSAPQAPSLAWAPATSQLLGWLLAGRPYGPVFLTDRRAPSGAPAADVCPVTGRARMSYRRAAEIFTTRTRSLDPAGHGWTLHQLRRPTPAR